MEVKPNKAIYEKVPLDAEVHNADLPPTKPEPSSVKFVSAFLKRYIPESRQKRDPIEDLQHKKYFLDKQGKSKERHFDLRPGKRRSLPCSEKKRLKVFNIDASQQNYSMHLPLHKLWKDYMEDLIPSERLATQNKSTVEQQLLRADYHGAVITVTRSTCPGLVGASGIVLQETRNVFKIITKDDRLKTIPKENTVFSIQHAGFLFTIYGNHFRVRSSDRVSKKFKAKATVDL